MDDVLDNTPDVAVLLGKVEVPQPSGVLVVVSVGLEDTPDFRCARMTRPISVVVSV